VTSGRQPTTAAAITLRKFVANGKKEKMKGGRGPGGDRPPIAHVYDEVSM
jgi:hypothetical protein